MYQRLQFNEREEISRQIAIGSSLRQIAKQINRAPSTISREIKRSEVVKIIYYRAVYAQQRYRRVLCQIHHNRKLDKNPILRQTVFYYLAKKWSPQQIAKRLKVLYPDDMIMQVSHETIYSYLYVLPRGALKKEILSCLRRNHQNRRRRKKSASQHSGAIRDYLSIEERPAEVAQRIIPGHWEGDLLMGSGNTSALGTLVERTTRMTFLVKLRNQDAMTVRKAFAEEFHKLPKGLKRTLTYDQGYEMAQHKVFTKETDIAVYFAHPHAPWERGTNENTNGLLRQYFPKGTDFSKITLNRIKEIQDEFNDRPRKTLNWATPTEKFSQLLR